MQEICWISFFPSTMSQKYKFTLIYEEVTRNDPLICGWARMRRVFYIVGHFTWKNWIHDGWCVLQAGFDFGDGNQIHLRGSMTKDISKIDNYSNSKRKGVFIFKAYNIKPPKPTTAPIETTPNGCGMNGRLLIIHKFISRTHHVHTPRKLVTTYQYQETGSLWKRYLTYLQYTNICCIVFNCVNTINSRQMVAISFKYSVWWSCWYWYYLAHRVWSNSERCCDYACGKC